MPQNPMENQKLEITLNCFPQSFSAVNHKFNHHVKYAGIIYISSTHTSEAKEIYHGLEKKEVKVSCFKPYTLGSGETCTMTHKITVTGHTVAMQI